MTPDDFSHLDVQFFIDTAEDKRASKKEGRPIFREVEKVRFRIAGDPKTVLVAPAIDPSSVIGPNGVRLTYAELHRGPYEAFKAGATHRGNGTPLSEAPWLTAAKRKELEALNVFTIDALAALEGANLSRLGMGGRDLKNQAMAWLGNASGSAEVSRLSDENEALKSRLADLEARMAGTSGSMAAPAPTAGNDGHVSPFAAWADEDIVTWIVENGGEKPHHRCSRETLIQKADELNASLAKAKDAA